MASTASLQLANHPQQQQQRQHEDDSQMASPMKMFSDLAADHQTGLGSKLADAVVITSVRCVLYNRDRNCPGLSHRLCVQHEDDVQSHQPQEWHEGATAG